MKIRNTTTVLPEHALPRMVAWCCENLQLPFSGIQLIEFKKGSKPISGRVIWKERKVIVEAREEGKLPVKVQNRAENRNEPVVSAAELLVLATAIQLAYLREYWEVSFMKTDLVQPHVSWQSVDKRAFSILYAFRNSKTLLQQWKQEPPAGVLPDLTREDSRERHKRILDESVKELNQHKKRLAELRAEGSKIREQTHKLYMRINYSKKAIAKSPKRAYTEWEVPERFVLGDFTVRFGTTTETSTATPEKKQPESVKKEEPVTT